MKTSRDDPRIKKSLVWADTQAINYYHYRFNAAQHAYHKATEGKSAQYINALLDEAMAICGSPYWRVTYHKWSPAAIEFLSHFVREETA